MNSMVNFKTAVSRTQMASYYLHHHPRWNYACRPLNSLFFPAETCTCRRRKLFISWIKPYLTLSYDFSLYFWTSRRSQLSDR